MHVFDDFSLTVFCDRLEVDKVDKVDKMVKAV